MLDIMYIRIGIVIGLATFIISLVIAAHAKVNNGNIFTDYDSDVTRFVFASLLISLNLVVAWIPVILLALVFSAFYAIYKAATIILSRNKK